MFRHSIVLAKIRAWLQRTCSRHAAGGVSIINHLASTNIDESSLLQRSLCLPYQRDTRTRDQPVLTTLICASVIPSHTPSSVHVMHAKEMIGFRTILIGALFSKSMGLMHLTLVGMNTYTTAQIFCLLRRESTVAIEKLSCLT